MHTTAIRIHCGAVIELPTPPKLNRYTAVLLQSHWSQQDCR